MESSSGNERTDRTCQFQGWLYFEKEWQRHGDQFLARFTSNRLGKTPDSICWHHWKNPCLGNSQEFETRASEHRWLSRPVFVTGHIETTSKLKPPDTCWFR